VGRNKEVQAIIAADAEAIHKDVVTAIDLVKSMGVERFAIQVEKEAKAP
jgi:biopolymer transport protein ExbD